MNEEKLIEAWFYTKTVQQEIHGDADLEELIECSYEVENTGFENWLNEQGLRSEFKNWLNENNLEHYYK